MRAKININTMSKIRTFVEVCSQLNYEVCLVDGHGYRVSAKSLVGAIATTDWSQVFIECEHDIYSYVREFLAE